MMTIKNLMLGSLCLFFSVANAQIRPSDMEQIEESAGEHVAPDSIKSKYPKFDNFLRNNLDFLIPVISVEELQGKLNKQEKIVLLDARSKEAYDISHLPNARRVGFDDFGPEKVWMLKRDAEVVVYCSAGTRSERVGKYLEMMGFTNVRNLYGSIYEWTNNDGEIVDKNNQKTNRVYVNDKSKLPFVRKAKPVLDTRGGDDPFNPGVISETKITE
jgi:rhodanese-related sulfurtransferase